jgi:hypothetical protein
MGQAIHVFQFRSESELVHPSGLAECPELFGVYICIDSALKQKLVRKIGAMDVPPALMHLPIVRDPGFTGGHGSQTTWQVRQGDRVLRDFGPLTPEMRAIPTLGWWSMALLVPFIIDRLRDVGLETLVVPACSPPIPHDKESSQSACRPQHNPLIKSALMVLLDELDRLAIEHPELTDTEVREEMGNALLAALVSRGDGHSLPKRLGMFSERGNRDVRRALAAYLKSVSGEMVDASPAECLAALQDCTVCSRQGTKYDMYFGHLDSLQ